MQQPKVIRVAYDRYIKCHTGGFNTETFYVEKGYYSVRGGPNAPILRSHQNGESFFVAKNSYGLLDRCQVDLKDVPYSRFAPKEDDALVIGKRAIEEAIAPIVPVTRDVVQVVDGAKGAKLLTFWCKTCETRHTIAVRAPGDKISLAFKGEYWPWNGDKINPTLGEACVRTAEKGKDCHAFIKDGQIASEDYNLPNHRYPDKYERMMTVDKWPLQAPDPIERFGNEPLVVPAEPAVEPFKDEPVVEAEEPVNNNGYNWKKKNDYGYDPFKYERKNKYREEDYEEFQDKDYLPHPADFGKREKRKFLNDYGNDPDYYPKEVVQDEPNEAQRAVNEAMQAALRAGAVEKERRLERTREKYRRDLSANARLKAALDAQLKALEMDRLRIERDFAADEKWAADQEQDEIKRLMGHFQRYE